MSYLERTDSFIASLGLQAYRVGGSVRDEILGRKAKDADYMICAPLSEIRDRLNGLDWPGLAVKPLVLRDGRQAGWRVASPGLGCIEITLPRKEVSTGPGHRDFKIVLAPELSLAEDAERRDFTFNALYKTANGAHVNGWGNSPYGAMGILDPTGRGIDDLQRRRINVTHADSFRDDPLRTLRALRFVSTLGYELGKETRALMLTHAEHVSGLTIKGHKSGTVLTELSKLLMGQDPAGALRVARDTGVLAVVLPQLAPMLGFDQGSRYHDMTTDEHTFTALETAAHVDAPLRVRWALLFHDSGKPATAWVGEDGRKHYYEPSDKVWYGTPQSAGLGDSGENSADKPLDHEIMGERLWRKAAEELHAPKALRDGVACLIRNHMVSCRKASAVKVRRERVRLGDSMLRDLYLMRLCDLSGKGNKNMQFMETIVAMEEIRANAQSGLVPASTRHLQISGSDVMRNKRVTPGPEVGRVLAAVLDEVVCDPTILKLSYDWQMEAVMRHG